jgi:hypothetical protein
MKRPIPVIFFPSVAQSHVHLLTVPDERFELLYTMEDDSTEIKTFHFYPSSHKTLMILDVGVSKTQITSR